MCVIQVPPEILFCDKVKNPGFIGVELCEEVLKLLPVASWICVFKPCPIITDIFDM